MLCRPVILFTGHSNSSIHAVMCKLKGVKVQLQKAGGPVCEDWMTHKTHRTVCLAEFCCTMTRCQQTTFVSYQSNTIFLPNGQSTSNMI